MKNKEIEYSVIYRIDSTYLESRGEILTKYIDKWLGDNGYKTNTYTFVIEEDCGDLIVDYMDSKDIKNSGLIIPGLVEKVFNKLDIKYEKEN